MVSDLQAKVDSFESRVSVKEKKFKESLKRMADAGKRQVAAVDSAEKLSRQTSLTNNLQTKSSICEPTLESEKLRRRTEFQVKELWYYVSAEVTKLTKVSLN